MSYNVNISIIRVSALKVKEVLENGKKERAGAQWREPVEGF